MDSFVRVWYRAVEEQNSIVEIWNDSMEYWEITVKQESSNFTLSWGLEPGNSISFEGKTRQSKKVKKYVFWSDSFEVSINKEQATPGKFTKTVADVGHGQVLKIEGVDI